MGCWLPSWWPNVAQMQRCELISTDSSRLWLFSRCVMYRIELEPLLDMSKGWEKLPNWPVWQASWPCLYCRQGLAIFLLDLPHDVLLSQQRWSSWPLHFFYRSQENQQMERRHRCACGGDPADEWVKSVLSIHFLSLLLACLPKDSTCGFNPNIELMWLVMRFKWVCFMKLQQIILFNLKLWKSGTKDLKALDGELEKLTDEKSDLQKQYLDQLGRNKRTVKDLNLDFGWFWQTASQFPNLAQFSEILQTLLLHEAFALSQSHRFPASCQLW